jgi:thiamine-phosphate pyrophosphorylase
MTRLRSPSIHLVTDRRLVAPEARTVRAEIRAVEAWIDRAVTAGVDVVQIRERDLDARALLELVVRVSRRSRGSDARVLVNDRADVAHAAGADGVHLPSTAPPVDRVRAIGPRRWLIGRSIHSVAEARAHQAADYLLFGTVFPSATKRNLTHAGRPAPWQGLAALARVARLGGVPVIAIGGVTVSRAREAMAAGAQGVAAIGLFLPRGRVRGAMGPGRGVAALRRALCPTPDLT